MMGQSESAANARRSSEQGSSSPVSGARTNDWVAMAELALVSSGGLPKNLQMFPAAKMSSSGVVGIPPTVSALPVGKAYFQAMQAAWRAPVPEAIAALQNSSRSNELPMDPDDIIEAIQETPGDILVPPVSLPFMIECLIEVWDEEGLYE